MTEAAQGSSRSPARPGIALLVGAWSVGGWEVARDGTRPGLLAFLATVVALAGIVAAVRIARGAPGAFAAYGAWAGLALVGLATADATAEPVAWKVGLGTALAALVLGAVAVHLRRTEPVRDG